MPILKRTLDLAVAATVLLMATPLLCLVALVIRMTMGSPVLFCQARPGLDGRIFRMLKFRTMREAIGENGALLPDADRLTRIGIWLRRTSLDELPELWNVLKGDMSLVGPRPLLPEYLPLYTPEQRRRHEVKPGITGWAQIHGRNSIEWEERFALDRWYVDHQSFTLDLLILARTIGTVLSSHGISSASYATMPVFTGSEVRCE